MRESSALLVRTTCAPGHFDVPEVLGDADVGPLVVEAGTAPVPAVGVRHDLVVVGVLLAHLFLAAVDVADVGRHVGDVLAVEGHAEVEDTVGHRVVGPMLTNRRSPSRWSSASGFWRFRNVTVCGSVSS